MSNILPMSSEAQAKYKAVYNEVFQETGDATKAAFAARAAIRTATGQPIKRAIITEEQVTELIDKRLTALAHLTPEQFREIVVRILENEIAKRVERMSLHELVVNAVGRHVEATIRAPDMKTLKNQLTDALQQRTEKLIEDLVSQVNFNTKIAPPPTGRKLHL